MAGATLTTVLQTCRWIPCGNSASVHRTWPTWAWSARNSGEGWAELKVPFAGMRMNSGIACAGM